jgi:hypothetical protein
VSAKKQNATIFGVGAAACAACCAGPILGVLAAIGLGTAAGFALFGVVAIVIGVATVSFVLVRRRRAIAGCSPPDVSAPVPVGLGDTRARP